MIEELDKILVDLHWMAQRYADGRRSYVTSMFNQHTKRLIELGFLKKSCQPLFAKDGNGEAFQGITNTEIARYERKR